jgi:uncharacterized protein
LRRDTDIHMSRLILFALIAFVIYYAWRGMSRKDRLREESRRAPASTQKGEDMVTCSRCGVNLPRSEAREEAGALVCADNPRCHRPA